MRVRRRLLRSIVAAVGAAGGFLLLEATCKILDVVAAWQDTRSVGRISRVSDVPGVRYELMPNVGTRLRHEEPVIRMNNLGLRGRDVAIAKQPGVYRIVVLGDSISFARDQPEEAIFPTVLERRLAELRPDRRFEVVNAGVPGRDTWEEAAILHHRLLALDPDLLILQICMNDHIRLPFPKPDAHFGLFQDRDWWSYSSLAERLDSRFPRFAALHAAVLERLGAGVASDDYVIRSIPPKLQQRYDRNWPDRDDPRDLAPRDRVAGGFMRVGSSGS
jgi:hypothetical protein